MRDTLFEALDLLAAEKVGILPLREIKRHMAVSLVGVPVGEDDLVHPVVIDELDAAALLGEKFHLRLLDGQQLERAVVIRQ